MTDIQADYIVVGAGASALAFVDEVIAQSQASVVIVDRRHRPGGHWLDAYPFVRLHQPSANYGVRSRPLGQDRIDQGGDNAGFYERATSAEICDYYARLMDDFVQSGRVTFLPMSNYRGGDHDGHHVTSLLSGHDTTVRAPKLVDATYVHSEIPSRRPPAYAVDDDVRLVTPNQLVDVADAPAGFTVIGAGKTSMDTCVWLLHNGVDPDRIRWIRPREPWLYDRRVMQPLDLVGTHVEFQGDYVEAAAQATDGVDFARRLEAAGALMRIDPQAEPTLLRGPITSRSELEAFRSIERVVRGSYVRRLRTQAVELDSGEVPASAGEVFVDCTAAGIRPTKARPVFSDDRIVLQYVTTGVVPWSAATIATVEVTRTDVAEKNRLCPPIPFVPTATGQLPAAYAGLLGAVTRGSEPDLASWNDNCRLNPAAAAQHHQQDPRVVSGHAKMVANIGRALSNLAERVAAVPLQPSAEAGAVTRG